MSAAEKKAAALVPGGAAEINRFPRRFSIAFTVLFLLLYWPSGVMLPFDGIFTHMEDQWMDHLFQMREKDVALGDPRIIVAAMDDDSQKKYTFPLPRSIHARLLDKLKGYGVKTVSFDVIFSEPREHDQELIDATRRFGHVIHLFTTKSQETAHGAVMEVHPPIAGLAKTAQYLGYPNIDLMLDDDGHVRRSMMFDRRASDPRDSNRIAPSMDIAAVASFLDKPIESFYKAFAEPEPRVSLINFRRLTNWLVHERHDQKLVGKVANLQQVDASYRRISIMDLVEGTLSDAQRSALKGSLVLVGSTSLGYFDHYPTPFTSQSPGVEYHANNIDNLLHDDYLKESSRGLMILVILFMIWLPMALLRAPPIVSTAAAAAVLAGWFALTYWQFAHGVRVEFIAPAVALVVAFLVQTVHRVLVEGQEKKFIKDLFGQFVAPEVVADLARDPSRIKLGGERRDMTVFFLDIAHFTTISEKMAPEALIIFLNKYLSALSHIIQEEKGVVDKYIGDCIMAFWNAPMELKDHRARACLAAIECQRMMGELNKTLDMDLPEIPMVRIGLNSGDVTVGLTGSEKKLQYTVIGDEVNLASRLEGANKFFGSRIMASESTVKGAEHVVEMRQLGRVRVVGKAIPIKVYELLAKKGELSSDWRKALPLYEQGVTHFNKREFEKAVACFQEVVKIVPADGPASLYLTVASDYSAIPPPEDWDGVFNLTAK